MENFRDYIKDINLSPSFLKLRNNGILLSDEEIKILKKYNIDYSMCKNTGELLFQIEEYLNDSDELEDLENLSNRLSEYRYYNEINK